MAESDMRHAVCRLDPRLWGKEHGLSRPYPVICHLLDTAAVFGRLWDVLIADRMRARIAETIGLGAEDTRRVLSFWAGLHDIGKITPPFQAQVPTAYSAVRDDPAYRAAAGAEQERSFRHETATHWSLVRLFEAAGYPSHPRLLKGSVSHQVAQLLGGHHGNYGPVLQARQLMHATAHCPGLGREGWQEQRHVHFGELRRILGADMVPERGLPAELAVVVTGLVVVADWLASQTDAIAPLAPSAVWKGSSADLDAHWAGSAAAAGALVEAAQLGRTQFAADSFPEMFGFAPNDLQRDLIEHLPGMVAERGPGLLLVTAPTGDGKTEAALYAASVVGRAADARGVYVALPTMATADGMYPRVRSYADRALGGDRALTLLHSMAWLSPAYAPGAEGQASTESPVVSAAPLTATEAGRWLRGPKRGLLAPLGTGTIDQVLSAMLPVTHNALRLFGLSEKVLIVDEAHAYGPWMHKLLARLLEWLGALRAPVVLLSATLTGRTATSLVDAYRRGAGHDEPVSVEPCYPGWLFADAATGRVSKPRSTPTGRARTLQVAIEQVRWDVDREPQDVARQDGRRAALRRALQPVVDHGGTALVCCTTVAEAQRTARDLQHAFTELSARLGGVRVLHSRYPAAVRQRIAAECEAAYGKPSATNGTPGVRPASILVATQVIEQSLDLDFDLVVSDLAPLAQLLQRAGRCRRHARGASGRPRWARSERRPRLVVLEPVDGDGVTEPPRAWGSVYDAGLLCRTALILREDAPSGIAVPGDVQRLIDAVYAEEFVAGLDAAVARELKRMDAERQAEEMAEVHLAQMVGICAPADVAGDLHRISRHEAGVTEELLTTRLGADTGRVLCLYAQPGGALTLDADGGKEIPQGTRSGLSRDDATLVLSQVVPVPGNWLRSAEPDLPVPEHWGTRPALRDLFLLRLHPGTGTSWSGQIGRREVTLSDVGLELGEVS